MQLLNHAAGRQRFGLEQPSVSKRLRVLRDVGLVRMRCQGCQKLYRTDAAAIWSLHEWVGIFERYWQHQLNRVKERGEAIRLPGSTELNFSRLKS